MAHIYHDSIYTKSFTPREYQVELLDAAKQRNIIVCLATTPAKVFIATKLVQEFANSARRSVTNGGRHTLYLVDSPATVELQASYVRHLTDLQVGEYSSEAACDSWPHEKWSEEFVENQVLVMTSEIGLKLFDKGILNMGTLSLIVMDECHRAVRAHPIGQIMSRFYAVADRRPRLLGLAAPLLNGTNDPSRLEAEITTLESVLHCEAETASDIVSILRYCNKPKELVMECDLMEIGALHKAIKCEVKLCQEFLTDHRYDPSEVYDEEFLEELKEVPDPKIDPLKIIDEILNVLQTLGPYCADKAARELLGQLEKLKKKIPYERHFLLLCMVSTVLIKIRVICDHAFQTYEEKERIYKFSSPKVLRLFEILGQFRPADKPGFATVSENSTTESTSEPAYQENGKSTETCVIPNAPVIDNKNNDNLFVTFNGSNGDLVTSPEILQKNVTNLMPMDNTKCDNIELQDIAENKILACDNHQPEEVQPTSLSSKAVDYFQRKKYSRFTKNAPGNNLPRPAYGAYQRAHRNFLNDDSALCGIIFVKERLTAKIIFQVLSELRNHDPGFAFLSPQFTAGKVADPMTECREAESEHRSQEEVLKRFRTRECNTLVATAVLEEGIDLPKCNLVVRFDPPSSYCSHARSKGRAKTYDAYYALVVERNKTDQLVGQLAQYMEIEKLLLRKCATRETPEEEELSADAYTAGVKPYRPVAVSGASGGPLNASESLYRAPGGLLNASGGPLNASEGLYNAPGGPSNTLELALNASVGLANAVALVNRYCVKLPSDTFTRLTPLWSTAAAPGGGYVCTVRLPINSPVKQDIAGPAMPSRVLARRAAALKTCITLHQARELDDHLLPIGKENLRLHDEDSCLATSDEADEMFSRDAGDPRPGTTKRRQYYYKRVAPALTDCRPLPRQPAHLYHVGMTLTCPLPEEQNTRGRRLYPPEDSPQGFGILTRGHIPQICPFPIFTRSGEVSVRLELADSAVELTEDRVTKIVTFLDYLFTNVLRLQKYLMMFDPQASENSYFVVPTRGGGGGAPARVDWDFLDAIHAARDTPPCAPPERGGADDAAAAAFDPARYADAVVMPWYRNRDQPQHFYVAEICGQLSPRSAFPGEEYDTFAEYYMKKYEIRIRDPGQPLLDVDHTSARLNFLTPRYVNRKGVALPTSSAETKRAKRENLEQKQILVPELCTVHPFPASLWRKAVCLPCVLYRVNALLLADQVRRTVAESIALGRAELSANFQWLPLDFGWSLADVLHKSKEGGADVTKDGGSAKSPGDSDDEDCEPVPTEGGNKVGDDWVEVGTWSNEMAAGTGSDFPELDYFDPSMALPSNLTLLGDDPELLEISGGGRAWGPGPRQRFRYGSPSSYGGGGGGGGGGEQDLDGFETDDSSEPDYYDQSDASSESTGLRIQFTGVNEAEAIEDQREAEKRERIDAPPMMADSAWDFDEGFDAESSTAQSVARFRAATRDNERRIYDGEMLVKWDRPVVIARGTRKNAIPEPTTEAAVEGDAETRPQVTVDGITFYTDILEPIPVRSVEATIVNRPSQTLVEVNTEPFEEEGETDLFSFDVQPDLSNHPGPSPSLILQALTMSNANDGINLERLETIGDSFLKYAITAYLYCTYENIHEGKLSHLRSKQVSNLNLYRLGRRKVLGESMIATKFEPHDNWLPPCYYVPRELEQALIEAGVPASHWNQADLPSMRDMSRDEICRRVRERGARLRENAAAEPPPPPPADAAAPLPCFIPYNLITQHSIPDKSIADCVEALIGAYLIECGPRGALIFMAWLGICVLPKAELPLVSPAAERPVGSVVTGDGRRMVCYGELEAPRSPLLRHVEDPDGELRRMLDGYEAFERRICYRFRDRSYLLQSMTHASYSPNRLTDCYQRLEFLGDAVLDYLITRHLYEDRRQHSPGALTDLRSSLVNNTIFASLAVRFGFHKYFRHLSPGLDHVVDRFVRIQEENGHTISEEFYLIEEEECEEVEDVEVPKALGDVFESVAGAVFLDSGMSLDAVWRVYYRMMRAEIEQFSAHVPKSPIRDLLELEPETAKFGKPEKLADGRRVRVTVEVFGKGVFKGIGRNYRIAKCTAAKCALKALKRKGMLAKK